MPNKVVVFVAKLATSITTVLRGDELLGESCQFLHLNIDRVLCLPHNNVSVSKS